MKKTATQYSALLLGLLQPLAVQAFWAEPVIAPDSSIPILNQAYVEPESVIIEVSEENKPVLDRSKDWLANYLNTLSGRIDTFFIDSMFGEDILEDDVRGSRARISMFTRRELGEGVDYKVSASVKLVLPNTNERFNLLLESEDDAEAVERDPIKSLESANYSTALRFIINESREWKNSIDAGVRWDVPPNVFVRGRSRRYSYFSDWTLRTTQSLFYYVNDGLGESTDIRMDYPINTEKLFRITAEAKYWLEQDYFDLNYNFVLYHELSPRSVLAYNAGATGDTDGKLAFNQYFAGFKYRRLIYSNWVYAEIAPQFEWSEEFDYRTIPVVMFRLEALISEDYL